MSQVFMKLWIHRKASTSTESSSQIEVPEFDTGRTEEEVFGIDNRKPNGVDNLLISPPKLDSCTELSTDCVLHIDSSIQILNEEFKSFPDLKTGDNPPISPQKRNSCNDSHSEPCSESSTNFVINVDSSIQVVENEYKSFPVLKTGEIKAEMVYPLTLGSCNAKPSTKSRGTKKVIKEVKVCKEVVVVKDKWIKQYCSSHKILLVGEGDFSFSTSLARVFGSASNMVATSLDSEGFLRKNYTRAISNIQELKNRGCIVMHGVDVTEMADHCFLQGMRCDRIIYNFPLVGLFKDESRKSQLKRNRDLVRLFFMNAKKMIYEKGEIHIAHKSCGFFLEWNLKSLAGTVGLRLINELPFNLKDFSGYCTKYGFGDGNNFDCNPSKRYIFGL